jgi:PAS domain S-box-containing protein
MRPAGINLQRLLDALPLTVVGLDSRGRITYVNETWRIFGCANEASAETSAAVGLDYLAAVRSAGHELAPVAEGLEQVLAGRRGELEYEYACHSPTQLRWFRLRAMPAQDGAILVHSDVTAEHLARAEARVRTVVAEGLTERAALSATCSRLVREVCDSYDWDVGIVWVLADDGLLQAAECHTRTPLRSGRFEAETRALRERPDQGVVGRVFSSLIPEWIADLGADSSSLRAEAAAASGLRCALVVPLGADGECLGLIELVSRAERRLDLALTELLLTSGAQLAVQRLRERAEARARAAEAERQRMAQTLDAMVRYAPALIGVVDRQGTIRFVNRALGDRSKPRVVGSNWLDYLPPEEHAEHRARLQRVFEAGTPETCETSTLEGGTRRWYAMQIGPLKQAGQVVSAVVIAQDVTDRRRMETNFAATQRWAAVGTLAAGIAHEINSPIQYVNDNLHFLHEAARGLLQLVQLLQQLRCMAEQADFAPVSQLRSEISAVEEAIDLAYVEQNADSAFERCFEGLERIASIVRSMKDFASPAQAQMAPVDLNRAIQSTLNVARNEYKYVAELETEFGDMPPVTCHVSDVNQVVLSLIENAADAISETAQGTDKKGKIRVCTRAVGDRAVISVSDTGIGIPDAIAGRVFEPFFTTKEVGKGSGQGLALAWSLIKQKHGGEIDFESAPGRGTTFHIRLPIARKL